MKTGPQKPTGEFEPVTDPERFPQAFAVCWNRKDARALAMLFSDDADFVNVTGIWWRSRQEIFKAHEYGLCVIFPDSKLKVTKTKIRDIGENFTLVHARIKLTGQAGHKEQNAGTRLTIFSYVLEKQGQKWLCCSAQNTDIVPGRETHIATESGELKAVDYREGVSNSASSS